MVSREGIEALVHFDELSDRLERAAWMTDGNIVEIGGGEGINTLRFLCVAREKKKTVIVVDPFEQIPGADESYFKPYAVDKLMQNITGKSEYLADHLQLIQLPSQDQKVRAELEQYKPIGFMFIDGLQDTLSVYKDLVLAQSLKVDIICVDDYDRSTATSQVPMAVKVFQEETKYRFIDIGKREAYFIK